MMFRALLVCIFVVAAIPTSAREVRTPADKERVNAFYREFVAALRDDRTSLEALTALAQRDKTAATQCLGVLEERIGTAGDKAGAFVLLRDRLKSVLLLAHERGDCSGDFVKRLHDLAENQGESADKIFVFTTLLGLCPGEGTDAYHKLGDAYLKERRFGMAVDAYRKGLELRDDEDSRLLLAKANELLKVYREGGPLSAKDVENLFKMRSMGVVMPSRRKVEMRPAIQTNRILFDEWSAAVKQESLSELKPLGEALRDGFSRDAHAKLVIEGHTDKRGDPDKNQVLSQERAEAVRDYLVREFGMDASRLITKGFGPSRPFSPRDDAEGWALNRRVEFKATWAP